MEAPGILLNFINSQNICHRNHDKKILAFEMGYRLVQTPGIFYILKLILIKIAKKLMKMEAPGISRNSCSYPLLPNLKKKYLRNS